jgi:hypothetical protein
MAIVGFFETQLHAGTINATASFSAQHNFASACQKEKPMATVHRTTNRPHASLVTQTCGALSRALSPWRRVAAGLMLIGALASAAQATDLALDPNRFFLQYWVNGIEAPTYQVVPATTGPSPFNTELTPFLLPCAVENFGGQLTVNLAPTGPAVYWGLEVRFFTANTQPIASTGFYGNYPFDHVSGRVTPPVQPGSHSDAGYTVLSTLPTNPFKYHLFQPHDLGTEPVRVHIAVTAYPDPDQSIVQRETNSANNVLDIWVQRACGSSPALPRPIPRSADQQ